MNIILHNPKSLAALSWLSLFALIWLLLFGALAFTPGAWFALVFFFAVAVFSGRSGINAYPAGEWVLPKTDG